MNLKEKAYQFFDAMPECHPVLVKDIAKRNPEAFIQYAKDYIDDGGQLCFSSDYKRFWKESDPNSFISLQQAS